MNKSYSDFSIEIDMKQIQKEFERLYTDFLFQELGAYQTLRFDKNDEYALLEYKKQLKITFDLNEFNNPNFSINISKDFSVLVKGFDFSNESIIKQMVYDYLIKNNYIPHQ